MPHLSVSMVLALDITLQPSITDSPLVIVFTVVLAVVLAFLIKVAQNVADRLSKPPDAERVAERTTAAERDILPP